MDIAHSKTRDQFPLSTKKIFKKTFVGSLGFLFLFLYFGIGGMVAMIAARSALGGLALGIAGVMAFIGLLIFAVAIFLVYLYQRWYFSVYFYDLMPDYVVIRKGPIAPREITLPYERIQDVYVDQDIFDRILGLYDVHLSTATMTSGMEAHIDGVEKAGADGLRSQLLATIQQKIHRTSVAPQPPVTP